MSPFASLAIACFACIAQPNAVRGCTAAGWRLSQLHDGRRDQRPSKSHHRLCEHSGSVGFRFLSDTTGSFNTGVGAGTLALNSGRLKYGHRCRSAFAEHHGTRKHGEWNCRASSITRMATATQPSALSCARKATLAAVSTQRRAMLRLRRTMSAAATTRPLVLERLSSDTGSENTADRFWGAPFQHHRRRQHGRWLSGSLKQ